MENLGGQEILMPVLQPKENWLRTGRWDSLDILFKTQGVGDKEYALGPTHEEVVVPLTKKFIFSYKDLPFSVFQIQTKFRDELRVKSGILRTREFLMKDLYSFHTNQNDLEKFYSKVVKSYETIFQGLDIGKSTYRTFALGGSFSKYSDEFQTVTEAGEDIIYICQKCKMAVNKEIKSENPTCPHCKSNDFKENKAIEVGNTFKLGIKYSSPFDLKFTDRDGSDKPVVMGCYGIGLSRLMGAVVEINHDNKGIVWPKSVAPFNAHIIEINPESGSSLTNEKKKIRDKAEKLSTDLQNKNIEVLYDDRQGKSAGEKFVEADLIGIPNRIVVSRNTLKNKSKPFEIKERKSEVGRPIGIKSLIKLLNA